MQQSFSSSPAMFRANPLGFILTMLLVPFGIGLIILIYWYLVCKTTTLELNQNDLLYSKGILNKDRIEIDIRSIRTVRVYQSLINRMFDVGTVSVFTAGDSPEIEVKGIPQPNDIREMINRAHP